MSKVFEDNGYQVLSTDIVDRGYGEVSDFLTDNREWDGDIVTNPPYKLALEFVKHSLDIVQTGRKVAMFLRLQFLEGISRRKLFDIHPPKTVYVCTRRFRCYPNGDFTIPKASAVCFAWFVWQKGYTGDPYIKWIN